MHVNTHRTTIHLRTFVCSHFPRLRKETTTENKHISFTNMAQVQKSWRTVSKLASQAGDQLLKSHKSNDNVLSRFEAYGFFSLGKIYNAPMFRQANIIMKSTLHHHYSLLFNSMQLRWKFRRDNRNIVAYRTWKCWLRISSSNSRSFWQWFGQFFKIINQLLKCLWSFIYVVIQRRSNYEVDDLITNFYCTKNQLATSRLISIENWMVWFFAWTI